MRSENDMGVRRFGRCNWLGLWTLAWRETLRFLSIWNQTIAAPLVTAGLFLAVFALAIGPTRGEVMGLPYVEFLAPGILMMTVIQNAFGNTSSSIMQAKSLGNIVDTLMPPLSPLELVIGYTLGGIARGVFVGTPIAVAILLIFQGGIAHPLWALAFVVVGSAFMAALGMIAAILANKHDQMAAITNFIITPLSFLSGTFYSTEALPQAMRVLTHLDPVFYMIDGLRYGMIGRSDGDPAFGLVICAAATVGVLGLCWYWFRIGFRIKS